MKGTPEPTDPFDMRGPGARLREAREAANISIDRIATSLLLDPNIIKAIEEDAYDRLPAPAFVRGYLRGYARMLGLPAGPILDVYDSQGFRPPPLGPGISEATQAHTSDTVVRIVTYAVVAVLVLLVGLWWHSQEDGGFGISADLFSESPAPATDSPGGNEDAPGTAQQVGETSAEAATATPGEPPVASPTNVPPDPMLQEGTAPGDIVTAESAPADATGTETASNVEPSSQQAPPAPSLAAVNGGEIAGEADTPGATTAQDTAVGNDSLATSSTTVVEQTPAAEDSDATIAQVAAVGDDILAAAERTDTGQTTEREESDDATTRTAAAEDSRAATAQDTVVGSAPLAAGDTTVAEQTAGPEETPEGEETDGADTQVAAVRDDSRVADDAAGGTDSRRADRPATAVEAADTAPAIEAEPTGAESSIAPTAQASVDTGSDSAAGTATARSGLVMEFEHESWVEVYDGARVRLFFGLVQPGRVLDFDGARPFDVLLGFGEDVRVTIDGQPFDHTSYLRHGVGRFKVGATLARDAEPGETAQPDEATGSEEAEASAEAEELAEDEEPGEDEEPAAVTESDDTPRPAPRLPSRRDP